MKHLLFSMFLAGLLSLGVSAYASTLILPSSLFAIEEEAFYGDTSLDKVVLPETVKEIGARAFAESSLNEIRLPESLSKIDDTALPAPGTINVTASKGSYAYGWAVSQGYIMPDVDYPESAHPYESNSEQTWKYVHYEDAPCLSVSFSFETNLGDPSSASLTITDSVGVNIVFSRDELSNATLILPGNSFQLRLKTRSNNPPYYGFKVEEIKTATWQEYEAWLHERDCDYKLNTKTLDDGSLEITGYSGRIIGELRVPSDIDGQPVTSIGNWAFFQCGSFTSVVIPEGIKSIGIQAFGYCNGLTNITIPASVISIGDMAFSYIDRLTEILVKEDNSAYSVLDGILYNKAGTVLLSCPSGKPGICDIPEGVIRIDEYSFCGCSCLTGINIPASVVEINLWTFSDNPLLDIINVSEENECYSSLDGVLFNKDRTELLCYPEGKRGSYVIPEGIINLNHDAFYDCKYLTSVHIPDSVTQIGMEFRRCTGLVSIDIPTSVLSIGHEALYGCENLERINILGENTVIKENTMCDQCKSLLEINICSGNIHYSSADGILFNKAKTEIIRYPSGRKGSYRIPDSVISIGPMAFSKSLQLTDIRIPNSVISIGRMAFNECLKLTDIEIPNGVTCIEEIHVFSLYQFDGSYDT